MRKCADMLMGGGGFEICDCTICDCANKKSVFSMRVFEREICPLIHEISPVGRNDVKFMRFLKSSE